ncbi:MAG: glycoside hydrolase family 28 protein [Tepidisphaeraceae bacterium]
MPDYLITDFGGIADGKTLNTAAFAAAITACTKTGGRVVVPAGTWFTGPIVFKDNVELNLERGAKSSSAAISISIASCPATTKASPPSAAAPLSAEGCKNISITGEGVFDGAGEAWRPVKRWKLAEAQWNALLAKGGYVDDRDLWWPTKAAYEGEAVVEKLKAANAPLTAEAYQPARDFLRPTLLRFVDCKNVTLRGCTYQNSPAWNVHILLCENVLLSGVTILNPWWSSNGDGLDLDACRNARVENSHFDCGDDAICIKSGKDKAGRDRGRACENITIENCFVAHGHGGVTVGSEMSGGVRNLKVTNCVFNGTDIGLRFKSTRGRGGTVENVEISNVVMRDIKTDAISLNLYYWVSGEPKPEPVSERTPIFRGMHFRNITCDGAKRAIEVRGLPESPIEKITFENVRMKSEEGVVVIDANDIKLSDVVLETTKPNGLRTQNVKNFQVSNFNVTGPSEGLGSEPVGNL